MTSRRIDIHQPVVEVQLTDVARLGTLIHKFNPIRVIKNSNIIFSTTNAIAYTQGCQIDLMADPDTNDICVTGDTF